MVGGRKVVCVLSFEKGSLVQKGWDPLVEMKFSGIFKVFLGARLLFRGAVLLLSGAGLLFRPNYATLND